MFSGENFEIFELIFSKEFQPLLKNSALHNFFLPQKHQGTKTHQSNYKLFSKIWKLKTN